MKKAAQGGSAVFAALLLSAVTLFTFYKFRDFGPESTVRRFVEAIAKGDSETANVLTTNGINTPHASFVIDNVQWHIRAGASPGIAKMERTPSKVEAVVVYQRGRSVMDAQSWVLVKQRGEWVVDTLHTAYNLSQGVIRTPSP